MKNGGHAFPGFGLKPVNKVRISDTGMQEFCEDSEVPYEGMSLRDWFAGQALIGGVAAGEYYAEEEIQAIAAQSYKLADAMLKARGE